MSPRHEAFAPKSKNKPKPDPSPHSLTDEEEAYINKCFDQGFNVSQGMVRKLLRLYKERTAACQHLIRKHESDPLNDPEKG